MALPGEVRKLSAHIGARCEASKCDYPATLVLCTESDSFGDEWEYRCEEHLPDPDKKEVGDCDGCGAEEVDLAPSRDPDEIHGPVLYLCRSCLDRQAEYVRREVWCGTTIDAGLSDFDEEGDVE